MKTSLKELAKKTGYSINTVSRALRDADDVKQGTKALIQRLARETGYIPNSVAKNLRLGRTNTIGVVSADSSNPFFAEVILGIEDAARARDYHILLVNTEDSCDAERDAIDTLVERQVDGLLIMPRFGQANNGAQLRALHLPFILVGRRLPGLEDHAVLSDEFEKAREVTSLFLKNGHRNVLHLAGPDYVSSSIDRIEGYRAAFVASGMPIDERFIVRTEGHVDDSLRLVKRLVKDSLPFSALFAFNDLVAIGAMRALKEEGFLVPRDVEVIGFDDLDISRYLHSSLSSVHIQKKLLGKVAVETLLEHMGDPAVPYVKKTIESRLILRETTTFEYGSS